MPNAYPLTFGQKWGLLIVSFFILALGQPAWVGWLGIVASICGITLFLRVALCIPSRIKRFLLGTLWFGAIQAFQLSWFISHPYYYIYAVLIFCALITGVQWGFLCILMTPKILKRTLNLFALAGLWTLLEWSRLFILSGLPFNPIGLYLTDFVYPLQIASVGGIYGLSFLVLLTNLFFLKALLQPRSYFNWTTYCALVFLPWIFGWLHLDFQQTKSLNDQKTLSVLLVQTSLPLEENMVFHSAEEARFFVLSEWQEALSSLQKHQGKHFDLIVFPEYLVPYGTFHFVYPLEEVQYLLKSLFLFNDSLFPNKKSGYVENVFTSNAYIAQSIANIFNSHVVIGLGHSIHNQEKKETYCSAFHFIPGGLQPAGRYDKRILVPMGEYIPFEWCRKLAARYGVESSVSAGTEAQIFAGPVPLGAAICYEEIYGHLMRENRIKGAELLVNLTNDGWYPYSKLPQQHFDHARLRTVENGIPLIRACNTGITGAVDSLGRTVAALHDDHDLREAIHVDVPLYHYQTLYSKYGDYPVLALSFFFIFCFNHLTQKEEK